jgi:cell division protein FtsI/penicillin-binding protein 2
MKLFKARLFFIGGIMLLSLGTIVGRLAYIQLVRGKQYATRAREQSRARTVLKARRGTIYDRNGYPLATSVPGHWRAAGAKAIGNGQELSRRLYPHGELAGTTLGYVGRDGYGLGGAEFAFDNLLRGENGWKILYRDGRNRRYSRIGMPQKPPVHGSDVYLSLDLHVQKILESVLKQTAGKYQARSAMGVVLNPNSGDVLAMASVPGFDPNKPGRYSLSQRINSCIGYNYEPGSTFKLITAASALQEGIKKETDTLDGNLGVYRIYDQEIRDHRPYGKLTLAKAIAYSSNVCVARIADDLGNERLFSYTRDFGLGTRTGIELPGEEVGIVHPIERWSGRTRVTMSIGQEVSTTLMQMVMVFATAANGGVLLEPRIHQKVVGPDHTVSQSSDPRTVRRVLSEETAQRIRGILHRVVAEGTGRRAGLQGIPVAGKTGTSQKIDSTGAYSRDRVWASFIGFAPVEKPVILCGIVIDEPADGEAGGVVAAPAFRQVLQQIVSHPQLEFAEKILQNQNTEPSKPGRIPGIPSICGMTRDKAVMLMRQEKIDYDLVGTGDTIIYQTPPPGKTLSEHTKLIAYTSSGSNAGPQTVGISVPGCTGKDLRDAVNAINLRGLRPFALGAGVVTRQTPTVGTVVRPEAVCTLFCTFEG